MSFGVEFDIDVTETTEALGKLERRLSQAGMRLFARTTLQRWFAARIARRFEMEGDGASGKWAALAFNTGRIRAAQGYSPWHPINVRSGELKKHLTTSFSITNPSRTTQLNIPGNVPSTRLASKIRTAQMGGYPERGPGAGSRGGGATRNRQGPSRFAPARPVLAVDTVDEIYARDALLNFLRTGAF